MAQSSTTRTSGTAAESDVSSKADTSLASRSTATLESDQGRTTIADGVVQKIAGIATREVSGVYNLGTGTTRAFGAIRERIPGSGGPAVTQGVSVEVGEKQAAIDLDIVVEYGVSIAQLAASIRRNVITAVERMTALEVIEVNIAIDDIHLPGDDEDQSGDQPSRVQ
ncbi:MAG TPA: Asp23/Gls24 family envelope stress response protein [Mycobacteriales bacterium]|nr:Asp23/Gls24 family envelope stress response protein [Mycobacteriales bacterium]